MKLEGKHVQINRPLAFIVCLLFVAVIVIGAFATSWHTVSDLPENPADPSNIEGIGMLIFTQFVAPFEVLSIVLLASLIGAIYMAKGEGNK